MSMRHISALTVLTLLAASVTGCGKEEEVRRYEAAKEPVQSAPVAASAPSEQRTATKAAGEQRLLGAIAVHGDKTWFFRLSGPAAAVGAQADNFHRFVHSLRFSDSADRPVTWSLPPHWHEGEATSPRYATIEVGHDEPPLELSVTAFPGDAGGVEANINRWREQLGLPPLRGGEELRTVAETHDVNGKQVIEIDMTGPGQTAATTDRPPAAPFAPFANRGSGGGPPAIGQRLGAVLEEPAENPLLTYSVPQGWREHAVGSGEMRKAALSVVQGDKLAEITFVPLGGAAGGLLSNVNRWRGEIGLKEVDAAEAEQIAQRIEIDGARAYYFDLEGEAFPDGQRFRTLVAMVPVGQTTWFIKMWGPADLVAREKTNFESLLRSVKFKG